MIRGPLKFMALGALLLGAANAQPTGEWRLTSITDAGRLISVNAQVAPTLRFDATRVSGLAGCNTYTASYAARADLLTFARVITTKKACPDQVLSLEERYLNVLRGVRRYELRGRTLVLHAGNDRMEFVQGGRVSDVTQTATRYAGAWELAGVNVAGRALNVQGDRPVTLTVEGARLSGNAPCNTYSATFGVVNGAIQVGPVASTRRLCTTDAGNQLETAFLGALRAARAFELRGEQLVVVARDGTTLTFRRASGSGAVTGASLEGGWTLRTVDDRAPQGPRAITLNFEGPQVGGNDGCNAFGGTYRVSGSTLRAAGPLPQTLMACPEPADFPSLTALLRAGATFSVNADVLTLTGQGHTWVFSR
ncbi:META domain-containing protein [Deinococcus maricopensis]|nr:META domain-containing protein [Deinococcus maricopensis]